MFKLPFNLNLAKPKESSKFLAVDIGADAVKCLAFYQEGAISKIIGAGKQSLDHGAVRGGSVIDFEAVELATKAAISQTTDDLGEDVDDVIFGVSGDVSLGIMTTAKATRGKETLIDQSEMDDLYKKIIDSSYTEANNEILQINGSTDIDLELVTSTPVYIKVDNVKTKDPTKTAGEEIEIAMFTAFSPKYHVKTLQTLAKKLGLNILAIGSEMYALVRALKVSKNQLLDCVLIDIGSDTTDVGIVFGGGIVSTRTLPIGGNHFTELLSQKMGITLREADNIKKSYSFGKLAKSEGIIVQNSLQEGLDLWLNGIELLFAEFTGVKTFSPLIYLTGGGSLLPNIFELISGEPWVRSVPFKSPPEFLKLSMEDLTKVSDSTQKVSSIEYLMTAALATIYAELKGAFN